jgi:hypothetical protein
MEFKVGGYVTWKPFFEDDDLFRIAECHGNPIRSLTVVRIVRRISKFNTIIYPAWDADCFTPILLSEVEKAYYGIE